MRDARQPYGVRRSCAEALLARGFGPPSQSMDMRLPAVLAKRLADLPVDELRLFEMQMTGEADEMIDLISDERDGTTAGTVALSEQRSQRLVSPEPAASLPRSRC